MVQFSLRVFFGLFAFLMPALVFAGQLDDYYLSRFAPKTTPARIVTGLEGEVATRADRCLTPLYRSLRRDWEQLEPTTQKVLAKHLARPVLAGPSSYPSPGGHFTIHYATSGADAPLLTDADFDGTPDWVEKVAAVFEYVYGVEVTAMGYRPPPVARYDVYLRDLTGDNAYGFTTSDGVLIPPNTSVASYIELDRAFSDPMFTENGKYTPEQVLSITAAHEFHHGIQYGYNYYFDLWYAEVTATWMEDEVYDSVNQLYGYLPYYLPQTGTLSLNATLDGGSEYGRWIFNRYLAERHSPTLIRDAWARLGTVTAPGDGSDIPMLPVLDAVIRESGSSLPDAFLGFAKRVLARDWTTHAGDLSRIPVVPAAATFASYPLTSGTLAPFPHYSFNSYRFIPAAATPDLTLSLTKPGGILAALFTRAGGAITEAAPENGGASYTVSGFGALNPATDLVILLLANSTGLDGQQASFSSVTPSAPAHALTLTFAGTGGGSVNGDMSCSKGTSCAPEEFAENATVTLMQTPNADSLFGGWSGACTGSGSNCQLTMDGAKIVTATFNAAPRVRIAGGATYSLLASAYGAAADKAVIQAQALLFDDGDLILGRQVSVRFRGGYDAGFVSNSGETAVRGRLLIRNGTLSVEGLVLR